MDQTETRGKTIILGVGNLLLRDEGVGVHVATNLMRFSLPDNIEVVEGGTDGYKLFHIILEADRLIVVDCVKGGGEPASIYRFDVKDYNHVPDIYRTSVHQVSILEVISMSGAFRTPPETTIIGIEPKELAMSMELTPAVLAKVPRVMELALEAAGLDPEDYREELNAPVVQPEPEYPKSESP